LEVKFTYKDVLNLLKFLSQKENSAEEYGKLSVSDVVMNKIFETIKGETGIFDRFSPELKIKLAFLAIRLGGSVEEVTRLLSWREFEGFCSNILEYHFFRVYRNFRFKSNKRRFEIDLMGLKKPYILCFDAKKWDLRPRKASGIRKSALMQLERCVELASKIPTLKTALNLNDWKEILIIPGIVTLFEEAVKIFEGVPVVPLFKFKRFIEEFEDYLDKIKVLQVIGRLQT